MTKAEILDLVNALARQTLNPDTLAIYYDDILAEIGRSPKPPLVEIELFDITAGDHTYNYDASAIKLLAVFAGTKQLLAASTMDMEAYDDDWRNLTGTPLAYNEGERTAREIALIPIPDADSAPIFGPLPFGANYPLRIGVQLYSVRRDIKIPDWIALFICMRILSEEYAHPSDYQNIKFSGFCDKLASTLWKAAGLT